jgi:hypothetical protein
VLKPFRRQFTLNQRNAIINSYIHTFSCFSDLSNRHFESEKAFLGDNSVDKRPEPVDKLFIFGPKP